ncbi:TetR family transcriptional regulator [Halomonas sp. ISL-60]|uniref:TetR/AcrR family transcriptional regulator n=1 Tax=Halomonas sp. ISL-56 TaxID=2819149 RepID=UPI001BE9539D|nr:TetR/AcrR family transcriptional regulator [Halomonas sp. ISL-56]MBT2772051.1 TetR family transcriptional regulator [Halomonas sp. ISL-60]MBT2800493.1 TetR family transcriptional regulator [Halomonas sp. ISL-56]
MTKSDTLDVKQSARTRGKIRRNAHETRERLLQAATQEFSERGYDGARMERIVRAADCNVRMAYHYFNDKEGLYLAVLERVYEELRAKEQELNLSNLEPVAGMRALVEFTFDHMAEHPEFTSLVRNENLLGGRMLRKSSKVVQQTTPLVGMIRDTLERGEAAGMFRPAVDPTQLYISILSLSITHINQRDTLSIIFEQDLADPGWLLERRAHAVEMVLSYLCVESKMSQN